MVGSVCIWRLVRLNNNRVLFLKVCKYGREIRTFSANSVKYKESEGDNSNLSAGLTSRLPPLLRRRRSLSPLERISGLLPQDSLSPEVMLLRDQNESESTDDTDRSETRGLKEGSRTSEDDSDTAEKPQTPGALSDAACEKEEGSCPHVPGERALAFGELLVAEYSKKGRVEFRKLLQLQSGARVMSSWGFIPHDHIVGKRAGQFLKTGRGVPILIRRPSLEDYVLLMKRGPAIAYPKVLTWLGCDVIGVLWPRGSCRSLFPPGCSHHADDDGRHRRGLCAGVRLRVRGHVSVPVQSRSLSEIYGLRFQVYCI